ncbi:PEP-CTERM sorting domain-containing protein [Massilia sp. S19_KUP03_FR1]|uniref:PEP-CTERM sorting domain-containing protein n=1 Tax=Massilia sp. S19_KUP03_FR1 TaxID=3025503 RepID=UPI002FCD2812
MKKILYFILFSATVAAANLAQATPSLSFLVSGDTFNTTFSFTNTSTDGAKIERFVLDLSTITAGGPYCFDTVDGGPCNPDPQSATPFSAANGTNLTTGFTGPAVVADGASVLDLHFSDFNVGESFQWKIDVDSLVQSSIYGNDLIGATVMAYFSNGLTAVGALYGVDGDPQAAALSIDAVVPTTHVPEPGTLALFGLAGAALLYRRKQK